MVKIIPGYHPNFLYRCLDIGQISLTPLFILEECHDRDVMRVKGYLGRILKKIMVSLLPGHGTRIRKTLQPAKYECFVHLLPVANLPRMDYIVGVLLLVSK